MSLNTWICFPNWTTQQRELQAASGSVAFSLCGFSEANHDPAQDNKVIFNRLQKWHGVAMIMAHWAVVKADLPDPPNLLPVLVLCCLYLQLFSLLIYAMGPFHSASFLVRCPSQLSLIRSPNSFSSHPPCCSFIFPLVLFPWLIYR